MKTNAVPGGKRETEEVRPQNALQHNDLHFIQYAQCDGVMQGIAQFPHGRQGVANKVDFRDRLLSQHQHLHRMPEGFGLGIAHQIAGLLQTERHSEDAG